MLTVEEMRRTLASVTYRPGWQMHVAEGHPEGPEVLIEATVPDAYHPAQLTHLRIWTFVPPCEDEAAFLRWLAHRLARAENHECFEWFQRDGVPIFDPHSDLHALLGVAVSS